MKIYGKTFPEIFALLPLSYKVLVSVSGVFIVFAFSYVAYQLLAMDFSKSDKGPLFIPGQPFVAGMLDPAITSDGTTHMMVYAAVNDTQSGERNISINYALSEGRCKQWLFKETLFTPRKDDLIAPDGSSVLASGERRYETPAIVFDPADKGREWKAFSYSYFWAGHLRFAQRYSHIAMKTAASPQGPWTTEEWILSAAPDFPPEPYQNLVRQKINPMHPSLTGYASYARPSVIRIGNDLFMSLSAFRGETTPERIIMLVSRDHGRKWEYVGTLLTRLDAKALGYSKLSGATLLMEKETPYIAAVFGNDTVESAGTFMIPLQDAAKGDIARTAAGAPAVRQHIKQQSAAPTTMGGGAAAYIDACRHGVVTSEHSGLRNSFNLFKTALQPGSADPIK